MVTTRGLASTP